jgi:hypothetical protein
LRVGKCWTMEKFLERQKFTTCLITDERIGHLTDGAGWDGVERSIGLVLY